jgi:hypothetical protein
MLLAHANSGKADKALRVPVRLVEKSWQRRRCYPRRLLQ